jgi:regulator of protease activity HflC (stomatin/prohibitin superfamily)
MFFLESAFFMFVIAFLLEPLFLFVVRTFGIYAVVEERTCRVYMLFGKVVGVLSEPGLHILPLALGPAAFIVNFLGKSYLLDLRLDQEYLRSQPVNSEEGAPMGIGIWYEMFIVDPVAYLFNNMDPRGSLRANISNATVRCLSNMPLAEMLETRHKMSATVREEVSPKSAAWGYQLGSIYVRKVHFRDSGMIKQIEAKVVNRLRQVTSAIRQDGVNQVSIITSSAEREAAVEFAKASTMRPQIVGEALRQVAADPEVAAALFEILETQRMLDSRAALTLVPGGSGGELLASLMAASGRKPTPSPEEPSHGYGASPAQAPKPPAPSGAQ